MCILQDNDTSLRAMVTHYECADFLDRYKPFIEDGKTVVVSPHKAWGPQTNNLVFQLRKRRVNMIILAGMLANLCMESHL